MKKTFYKKITAFFLLLSMVLMLIPIQVSAESIDIPDKMTLTYFKEAHYGVPNSYTFSNGSVKKLKSSNPAVASVSQYSWTEGSDTYSTMSITPKKAGKTTISFKYDKKTYTIKVTVKNYTNAISSVRIGSTTIASSKFNSSTNYSLSYSKFAGKKSKVTIKLKNGWKLSSGFHYFRKGWLKSSSDLKNGTSVKITGGKGFIVGFWATNQTTGQSEYYRISFQ